MSALSLAVIGKDREPLYMREFKDSASFSSDEELFGLPTLGSESNAKAGGFECSIRHQFILHAALDRYEQLAGPPPGLGFRFGLLTPVEEMRVYGYVSATKILFILVVEDDAVPEHQQTVDADIKSLMTKIHGLYVDYEMNPFKEIGAPIVSKRFDEGVAKFISAFNQSDGMI